MPRVPNRSPVSFVTGTPFTCQESKRWAMRLMQFQWFSGWLNGCGRAKNALYLLDVTVPRCRVLVMA